MKIGIIEWFDSSIGKGTKTYSPYIKMGKNKKDIMFSKDGRPIFFYSRKDAKEYAKDWISEQESKP